MAGRIKGITVEIGGDTTGLEKALKNVNSTIKNIQSQLKDVNRLLKLDPSNTELLSQKQRALKEAIPAFYRPGSFDPERSQNSTSATSEESSFVCHGIASCAKRKARLRVQSLNPQPRSFTILVPSAKRG